MSDAYYEKTKKGARGACRLPVEVIYQGENSQLRIWTSQGDGRPAKKQELLDYAKDARKWADILEKIAKEVP